MAIEEENKQTWRYQRINGKAFGTDYYFVLLKNNITHSAFSSKDLPFNTTEEMLHLVVFTLNNIAKTENEFKKHAKEFDTLHNEKLKYKKRFFSIISIFITWIAAGTFVYFETFHSNNILSIIDAFFCAFGFFWFTDKILELMFL